MRELKLIIAGAVSVALLSGCELPPQESTQQGFRGTGMVQIDSPETKAAIEKSVVVPDPLPPVPAVGPKAGEIYQNVQVLGDLSAGQFTRIMTAITQWVSPEQGCNYCHNPENMASDEVYAKVVSRRMIQMTQHINVEQQKHVGNVGVTCYTCHRGKNVPEYIWFDFEDKTMAGMVGGRNGQNRPEPAVGYASLPSNPFDQIAVNDGSLIRVNGTDALPDGNTADIHATEKVYALMMHYSTALGVNCTYCHNTRAIARWEQSPPARTTAWHGTQMVRGLNQDYLNPLQPVYPDYRLGPEGDAPKANCLTCHQGQNKPLGGAPMAKDYPSLTGG